MPSSSTGTESVKGALSPGSRTSTVSKVPGSVTRGPTNSVGSMAAEAARVVESVSGDWEEKAWRLMRVKVSSLTLVTVPLISTSPCAGATGVMVSMWTTSGSSVGCGCRRGRGSRALEPWPTAGPTATTHPG